MRLLKLWKVGCSLALLAAQAASAATLPDSVPERMVLIGYPVPLSGASSAIGQMLVQSAEIAIDDLNAQHMQLNGERLQFKLLIEDDRSDPRTGVLVAQYLVQSAVVGVIGHWNSGVGIAASRIYNAAGVVQIAASTSAHAYTQQGFTTAYRVVPQDDQNATATADYVVRQMKAKRIAVIDDQTPFGAGYARQFMTQINALKGNIVDQFSVSSSTSDFNAVLRVIAQDHPDAVFFGGLDTQGGQLARELRRFGIQAPLIGAGGTVGSQFLQIAGSAGEGTVALAPGRPSYQGQAWLHFQHAYQQRLNAPMHISAPFAYDAVALLAAAIRKANSLDRQAIAASMRQIRHNGITGKISFDANGNLANPVFTIFVVKNQQWQPLKTISGNN